MSTTYLLLILCAAALLHPFTGRCQAEATPVTIPDSYSAQGFELSGNGLHWWHDPTLLDGDNHTSLYRLLPPVPRRLAAGAPASGFLPGGDLLAAASYSLSGMTAQPVIYDTGLPASFTSRASVVRDAAWFYYVRAGLLRQRLIAEGTAAGDSPVTKFDGFSLVNIAATGACLLKDGRLWYRDSAGLSSVALNGTPAERTSAQHFIIPGGGVIEKMTVNGSHQILLLQDGRLFFKNALDGAFSGQQLLGSDVTDFAVRADRVLLFGSLVSVTMVYACEAGALWQWNSLGGTKTTLPWSAGGTLTSVALDDARLFAGARISVSGVLKPCTYRKSWPREVDQQQLGAAWELISTQTGEKNLRSDGRYLYALRSSAFDGAASEIRALPTDAPALRLDVEARGLEAVQVIQDLNNDVPLVAGREAWVRAYAWIAENTASFGNALRFPAQLEVRRGGSTLARLVPVNDPLLAGLVTMTAWRKNVNAGYLFRVPPELLTAGTLEFRFTVNPTGRLPETEGATRSNTATDTVTVVAKKPTLLSFVRIHSTAGTFEPSAEPGVFHECLEKARSLLPVSRFVVHHQAGIIYKPVPKICVEEFHGVPVAAYPCIVDRSFDMDEDLDFGIEDKDWAMFYLGLAQATNPAYLASSLLDFTGISTSDIHWCGTVPAGAGSFNGVGNTTLLNTLIFRVTNEAAVTDGNARPWDRGQGGRTLAHELGHNYGLEHINAGSPDGPFDPFPVPEAPAQFEATDIDEPGRVVGFDSRTLTAVTANNSGVMVGDLMTYTASRWPSRQTYMRIFDEIPNASGARSPRGGGAGGPLLLVSGMMDAGARAADFAPCFVLPPGAYPAETAAEIMARAAALPATHPLRIRLLNAAGAVLSESGLLTMEHADEGGTMQPFLQYLTYSPATRRLQVLRSGTVIGELPVSAAAPVLTAPQVTLGSGWLRAAWNASDTDGDTLSFAVQFSNDNGAHWTSLTPRTAELALTVDRALLPGGAQCRVRVLASDGINTVLSQGQPFTLPRHAPALSITGVTAGERLDFGALRELDALVTEPEDGTVEDDALTWMLRDLARGIQTTGTGPRFPLQGLAPGRYEISLTATDSDGMTGSETVAFEVKGVAIPNAAAAPVLDGMNGDEAYAQSPVMRMDFGSGLLAHYYGTTVCAHHGGQLYVCITDLQKAAGLARVRLLLDTDHSGGAPQSQDLAIEVREDGTLTEWRGNGSTWVQSGSPGGAVALAMLTSGSNWSVELALPDGLLGGWSQDAGLAVVHYNIPVVGSWPAGLAVDAAPAAFAAVGPGTLPSVPNAAPVVHAGVDRVLSLEAGEDVMLDAAQSLDPEGAALTYQWQQLSGPSLTIRSSGGVQHTVAAPEVAGPAVTCVFQVTVSDGQLSAADAVNLTFTTRAPQLLSERAAAPVRVTPAGVSGSIVWPDGSGKLVMLQTSTDLAAWQDLGVHLTGILGSAAFADGPPAPGGKRFYRLKAFTPEPVQNPGTALRFDDTNSFVSVPHDPALNAFPLTVSAWVLSSTNDGVERGLVEKYVGSSLNGWMMYVLNGRLRAWYFHDGNNYVWRPSGDGGGVDGGFIADGFWHHCAFTVDATGGTLYVDGQPRGSMSWIGTPGPATTTTPLHFGKYDQAPPFIGDLDDIMLWNRALTPPEIAEAVRVSPNAGAPGLLSIWRFDEATGSVAGSSTAAGYNGTLSGSVQWVPSSAPIYRQ